MSDERVRGLLDRLHQQVAELSSATDWERLLKVASRFHKYSATNVLLILCQRPDATQVAGYQAWKRLGRQVRKGEKGLAILAPIVVTRESEAAREERAVVGYRVTHVFDVSQTDGPELPSAPQAVLLDGDDPDGLAARFIRQIEERGFGLRFPDDWSLAANGYADFRDKVVAIRPGLSPAQRAKTLCHELGHLLLHDGTEYANGERERCEVEAESLAYVVANALGLTTASYSIPYVTAWSGGDMALVLQTAERVVKAAATVLAAIPTPDERRDDG